MLLAAPRVAVEAARGGGGRRDVVREGDIDAPQGRLLLAVSLAKASSTLPSDVP